MHGHAHAGSVDAYVCDVVLLGELLNLVCLLLIVGRLELDPLQNAELSTRHAGWGNHDAALLVTR